MSLRLFPEVSKAEFNCGEVQQPCSIIAAGHRSLCNLSLPKLRPIIDIIENVANAEADSEAEAEAESVTEAGAV